MKMHERIDGKLGVHSRQEVFESVSGDGGSENFVSAAPVGFDQRGEIFGGEQIGFIENLQAGTVLHAEVGENFDDVGILAGGIGFGDVADLNEQGGFLK